LSALTDICDLIKHRKAIHDAAYQSDIARLKIVHGAAIVDEVLRMIAEDDARSSRRYPPPPRDRVA